MGEVDEVRCPVCGNQHPVDAREERDGGLVCPTPGCEERTAFAVSEVEPDA